MISDKHEIDITAQGLVIRTFGDKRNTCRA